MVNIKKIRWIPFLMVVSQLMLAGFVAYWLKGQYDDEKELLHEDLSRIYDESSSQVIDSLLFNRVVEPVLNDSVTITVSADDRADSVLQRVAGTTQTGYFTASKDSGLSTFITIPLPDSSEGEKITSDAASKYTPKRQDMLIRSIRLFISHSGDSLASRNAYPTFLPGKPDTEMFKKIYLRKVQDKKWGVIVLWKEKDGNDSLTNKKLKKVEISQIGKSPQMHFSNVFPDNLPQVEISHEFPYLIRRMSTQILFAFILLFLTGSAFFFTNRSLNRQLILNSLRNDFVSNITHELRTPVSTVKVALEALKTFDKVANPAITKDYLDMASQEINRLDQLIGKVLDQSLIGEQKQVIQPVPSDLKSLIEGMILSIQPRLDDRQATVVIEDEGIPNPVMVDPLYFQGVMMNLIDNSMKYGPVQPVIQIRLFGDPGNAWIEVSDNGPGIPKEYLSRVFDKFFRVPTGNTHNIKGYGLGLSFASLVMKQHDGSISVKNLDPEGCTFTLRFPYKTA